MLVPTSDGRKNKRASSRAFKDHLLKRHDPDSKSGTSRGKYAPEHPHDIGSTPVSGGQQDHRTRFSSQNQAGSRTKVTVHKRAVDFCKPFATMYLLSSNYIPCLIAVEHSKKMVRLCQVSILPAYLHGK